ncbi:unnamed protein product [Mycena citricolor]|uniref:Uncharacterized protein n=1 Tax=Mycena citricolor TaxID=2018698 RepID=A0AAD2HBJ5_9AGAR|nr:unnamed protein product [Mycena citricolor]
MATIVHFLATSGTHPAGSHLLSGPRLSRTCTNCFNQCLSD